VEKLNADLSAQNQKLQNELKLVQGRELELLDKVTTLEATNVSKKITFKLTK
jgi:hypothetical protein